MDDGLKAHQIDPAQFLKGLPLDWKNQKNHQSPPFKTLLRDSADGSVEQDGDTFKNYLQLAIDCGVLYYLTEQESYAQCGLDILHIFIQSVSQMKVPIERGNKGRIYIEDHLYEARTINAQLPIIYDFIAPFIAKGGKPYDIVEKRKIAFSLKTAQNVFRTYAQMVIDQGMTGSNWSVLEAASLVQNALALDDYQERNDFLNSYLTVNYDRQDSFLEIASHFKKEGDVYPETSQYSDGVAWYSTVLMNMLSKYDPELHLGQRYPNIPLALAKWEALKYPNGEIVRFGDGKRTGGTDYRFLEMAYTLGETDSVPQLMQTFGPLIHNGIQEGTYARDDLGTRSYKARPYFEPLYLLWFARDIQGASSSIEQPRTDTMSHASVFLQRNPGEQQDAQNGLMCFVGGAHMVHGHASGMDMELYGKGQVLGVDNGNGPYRKDIHENYSRLFAAHNTVIVNGASQSDGGWVNLGINPVALLSMEPMPLEEAVSPNYSFSRTRFVDDKGNRAEAEQERTLALVRTSKTTGYYVDIFRSKSKLPDEFHDYLYHNIGDRLEFLNPDLNLNPDPERYMANASAPWVQNRRYRHPGWHFFEDVQTTTDYPKDVVVRFPVEKLGGSPIFMQVHLPGFENRQYTKVKAPKTFEAPKPYDVLPTPTLIVRKRGEAWNSPFVAVYEPYAEEAGNNSVLSVEKLMQHGVYKGLKISSNIGDTTIVQYVLTQSGNDEFIDTENNIFFKGTFAIITTDVDHNLKSMYLGDGEKLSFQKLTLQKVEGKNFAAYLDVSGENSKVKTNGIASVTFADGTTKIIE